MESGLSIDSSQLCGLLAPRSDVMPLVLLDKSKLNGVSLATLCTVRAESETVDMPRKKIPKETVKLTLLSLHMMCINNEKE